MAVPDYEEYSSGEDVGEPAHGAAAAHGPLVPVPATDYLGGACIQTDQPSQIHTSVLCARAQLVTSVSGSPPLDPISRVTVQGVLGSLSYVPTGIDVLRHEHLELQMMRAVPNPVDDRQASSPLSIASLENAAVLSVSHQETGDSEGDQEIRGTSTRGNPCQYTVAECRQRESRLPTSGYVSESVDQGANATKLSEPDIHEFIIISGLNRHPCFQEFRSLQSRLSSFPRAFRLDGVQVNRDLLAVAGFFYSCSGGNETVTCYSCGCSPRVWRDGQVPLTEHRYLSPYCKALPRVGTDSNDTVL